MGSSAAEIVLMCSTWPSLPAACKCVQGFELTSQKDTSQKEVGLQRRACHTCKTALLHLKAECKSGAAIHLQGIEECRGGPSTHIPEDLQQGLAVGDNLVLGQEGVAVNGGGVALHAEVAPQLHVEAHLCPPRPFTAMKYLTSREASEF